MTTEFNWHIAQLIRHTADGVVTTAHYTIDAKDAVYSAAAYGSVGLEQPDPETMIPFDSLSEEIVVEWVKEKLGGDEKVEEIEAALQSQLDQKHAPTEAAGLPWAG
jgi:hypothetical protein